MTVTMDNGSVLLVDTGPDLRLQALRENMNRVDAVLYTHYHADHLNGLDDLRSFCQRQRKPIPVYANEQTLHGIMERFAYAFPVREQHHWDKPVLSGHIVKGCMEISGVEVHAIPVMHGPYEILGYRIGNMAYLTDVSDIPAQSLDALQGLDVLFLDCLRDHFHPTHFNTEQALDWAKRIGARQTWLIHMTHDLEYEELSQRLPPGIQVAYDGLRLTFPEMK
jgi:phosphoribosyl 1,2-cyclic phosphate phosphodiesterase